MTQSAREFFEGLQTRLDASNLDRTTASYRFDIDGAGSWRVDLANGEPTVVESVDGGDCVIRMKEEVFLRVLSGAQNPMTAFMTGKIKVDGDMALALRLKDVLG